MMPIKTRVKHADEKEEEKSWLESHKDPWNRKKEITMNVFELSVANPNQKYHWCYLTNTIEIKGLVRLARMKNENDTKLTWMLLKKSFA